VPDNNVTVEPPQLPDLAVVCPGCEKTLYILNPHLTVQVKPERAVVVNQPFSEYEAIVKGEERTPEQILAAGDTDEEEESVSYIGYRSGAGEHIKVHDYDCLAKYAKERKDESVKIKYLKLGEDDYESSGRGTE
jgi:hypothetical protein